MPASVPREVRQAFLQLMLSRKVMKQADAEASLSKMCADLRAPYQEGDLKACLASINKDLAYAHFQIRGVNLQGQEHYGIVNMASDDIAKAHATRMKDWEKNYFKLIIKELCDSNNEGVPKDELVTLKAPIGGTAASVKDKETVLFTLEADYWLRRDKHARIYLAARTFLELGDFVRANHMELPQILYF